MAEQETFLAVLKASYDYVPQPDAEEELAIKEGQFLLLLERTDNDWWKVKIKPESQDEEGASGLIPAAYVESAEHTSIVKALYDYEATQSTELNVKEDDVLYVYGKDDDWLLVRKELDETQVGYVPANYVEEMTSEEPSGAAARTEARAPSVSQIVVPPSPPRPVSTYVDPAERVAASSAKAQADDIQTWAISEIDKKGKKKKGTLGVGGGQVFFASADKAPVLKWQTADIQTVKLEKSKHIHIDMGGSEPVNLHFHGGSKDVAEAIVAKLGSSRLLSAPPRASVSAEEELERPRSSAQKAVHFDAAEPEIIPPREPSDDEEEEEIHDTATEPAGAEEGEAAVVLYDFTADGEDELSVQEGENLLVLERDSDEWWRCRNVAGSEGVVPASYVELVSGAVDSSAVAEHDEDAAAIAASRAAKEAEARAEAERQRKARERAERERAERERKRMEAEQRAQAAAAAAELDRKRREQEREKQKEERVAAEEEMRQKKRGDRVSPPERQSESSQGRRMNGDSQSSGRTSTDRRGPPPENTRVWHDRTGQFRVEAAFLGFANGKLRLHKVNGVVIEVPSEKMSAEDLKYIEKVTSKKTTRKSDDDDEPLELRRISLQPEAMRPTSRTTPKKGPTVDWFEFFLNAGCDVDDCTRYATSFERDKIDEAILPDITESTMRSLGLREGDIIRVKKAIDQKYTKTSSLQEQLRRDEALAGQIQSEENGRPRGQPPNLFAGPDGALKNNSMRRGRPQPSKPLPLSNVDLQSIASASDRIQRTGSPQVASPGSTPSATPVQPPSRSSSAAPKTSGFDDDAWTNRPSSTKPLAPTPPVVAPRAPSAPPAPVPAAPVSPAAPPVPVAAVQIASSAPTAQSQAQQQQLTAPTLAKTESDIFDQLARLGQLRAQSPAVQSPTIQSPARTTSLPPSVTTVSPPISYRSGLGMGPSPVPMGQHLQNQHTGLLQPPQMQQPTNGPRGPLAPVPVNQTLLQPLIPTTTGFNSFVPTRPQSAQSPFQTPPQQPSFLSSQPSGFPGSTQPLAPQMTGFPRASPMLAQPTGLTGGSFPSQGPMLSQPTGLSSRTFGSPFGGGFGPTPSFQNNSGFGQIQSNPTGFNPAYGQSPFANGISSPPSPPSQTSVPNTSPANVFAQMKSGTFANDNPSGPQGADKYDALRTNPSPLTAQPTGWGFQGMNSGTFTGAYGFHR
ncbi:hypothetical protein AcV7_008117 [Taiwanofungus camphoratus]|nr:hypothetical protein AcW2_006590 [Antrodia cinnamomea]KAI0952244.1 hypothetical protein AcV7_008117 [Antrodia cinnamomea]